jgi:hypothetical protein
MSIGHCPHSKREKDLKGVVIQYPYKARVSNTRPVSISITDININFNKI